MLEKISIKNLYKIIGSVILAVLILLCVLIFASKNKKKPDKTSAKVTDSSMVDESSDKDSSSEDSSSADNSKTDSKADSSSVSGDSSAVVTDVQGKVIPTAPSSGGTQPDGGKQSSGGGSTTKTTTGTTTTTPSTSEFKFSIQSFTPYAEKNITTGLGMPVFEYIFGKQTTESGIPTKCIQQRDTVILKTNQPITKLDFDSSLINATYSGNTITVTAKPTGYKSVPDKTYITVNGKYKYSFKIYPDTNYTLDPKLSMSKLVYFYWRDIGTMVNDDSTAVTYSNGNINESITQKPKKLNNVWYDDTITYNGINDISAIFNLLYEYKNKGYTKLHIKYNGTSSDFYLGACK